MTTITTEDAIKAAASVARDVADGKLSPSDLEAQAAAELTQLVGTVAGPDDPIWPLQLDIARQVLALGGVPADELAEWLAVARHRAGEPVAQPDADETTAAVESLPSGMLSADFDADELADADAEQPVVADPEQPVFAVPVPPRRADVYDPLAAWPPSRTLRRPL
ncbi:flagellar hook-length control protein [Mycobacterium avium]|uniref:flagellar hook-length control protein n=1 Tax=Mycobacterium avium TaxID=1764 RepID=UPI000A022F4A|nr:flagellar hook-length control protein [Mycobacterium avium]MDV3291904.1 flagellar hook-length control protein [Mycobacterium avium subsp. hominissuis]TXA41426.1 flagellar hook-length control protein [Mycobacterium tuberculosis variant bovis]